MRPWVLLALAVLPAAALRGEEAAEAEAPTRLLLHGDVLDAGNIRELTSLAKAEEGHDWEKALSLYGELVSRYGGSLAPDPEDPRRFLPLSDLVRQRLLSLPPEILARHRLRLDAEARDLIAQARGRSDPAPAREVMDRLPLSSLARQGAEILGDLLAERGELGGAASAWEQAFLGTSLGGERTPSSAAKLALARALQGRRTEAVALARQAAQAAPDAVLFAGGERLTLSGLAGWIEAQTSSAATPDAPAPDGWPTAGGSGARWLRLATIASLDPDPAWKYSFPTPPPDARDANPFMLEPGGGDPKARRPHPRLHAAVLNGVLSVSDGTSLHLVDLKSGKRLEARSWPNAGKGGGMGRGNAVDRARCYGTTFAAGLAVGNVQRPPPAQGPGAANPFMMMGANLTPCGLLALDPATRKIRWWYPDPAGDPDDTGLDLRANPLLVGDILVSAATRRGTSLEIWLVGLDPASGKRLWKRFLCASSAVQPFEPAPEPTLAAEGGTVFCLTQLGALAAVEAATGRPLWTSLYGEGKALEPVGRGRAFPMPTSGTGEVPLSLPLVRPDAVFLRPADAAKVFAYDPATGKLLWQKPTRGDQLLGFSGSHLILTGGGKGYLLPEGPGGEEAHFFIPGDGAAGRGIVTQDSLLLPTQKGIERVDLATRKAAGTVLRWTAPISAASAGTFPGANLVVADGVLAAVGERGITVHPLAGAGVEELRTKLQAQPADPDGWLRLARLLRARKDPAGAISALREGLAACASNPRRGELSEFAESILRGTAAAEPARAVELLRQALELPLTPEREAALRLDLSRALAQGGRPGEAAGELEAVLARLSDQSCSEGRAGELARSEMQRLLESTPALRDRRDADARDALSRAGRDPARLRELLARFPDAPASEEALLLLGEAVLAQDEAEGTRLLVSCAERRPGSPASVRALRILLDRARAAGDASWTSALTLELRRQAPGDVRDLSEIPDAWSGRPFPPEEAWHAVGNERVGLASMPGEGLGAWSRAVLLSSGQMLDLGSGKLVWQPEETPTPGPWMGVTYQPGGTALEHVRPGTQAERAGLKAGDVLLSINNLPVEGDLPKVIAQLRPGQTVTVKLERDKKILELPLQLARRPGGDLQDFRFRWCVSRGPLLLLGSGREVCGYDLVARRPAWRRALTPDPEEQDALDQAPPGESTWAEVGGRQAWSLTGNRLVVRDEEGGLHGVDALTGERLWSHKEQGFGEILRAWGEDRVIAIGPDALHVVDRNSGKTVSRVPLAGVPPSAAPLILEDACILPTSRGISRVDLKAATVAWDAPFVGEPRFLAASGGTVVAAGPKSATALDPASGKVLWTQLFQGLDLRKASVSDGRVYAALQGEGGAALLALDLAKGGTLWKCTLGRDAACPDPIVLGDFLVADGGRDPDDPVEGANQVLFLDRRTGKRMHALNLPWSRGRLQGMRRSGDFLLLETTSGIYCYRPGKP